MANLMEQSLAAHRTRLQSSAGGAAVYIRANFRIPISVVLGQTVFEEANGDQDSFSETKSIDFLINPAELKLGNDLLEPQRGDRIEYGGESFDLLSGMNGQTWKWSNGWKTFYRVHTLRRASVAGE
jgi:hypothetical protein